MEDQNQDPHYEPHEPREIKIEETSPPPSNQNLIIGIVLGAVVLLLLLLVMSQQFQGNGGGGEDPEVALLKEKIEAERKLNEKLRFSGASGVTQSPDALVSQIKADTEALGKLVDASNSDAAALRTARADASSLYKRNEELSAQVEKYRSAAMRAEDLQQQLNQLRQSMSGKVDQSRLDQMTSELELVKNDRDRLQGELTQLRSQQQNMVDPNTYALLRSELDQFRESNLNLRAENQRLMTELAGAKLFVTRDDLSPRAVALYRELKTLEQMDHTRRMEIYDTIKTQLKATVHESISFKTGQADIAREHEAHIQEMAEKAPPTSFFLVVGYASPSGDSQTNEELSSKRATRVASMVNYLKKEGQGVQAVYLGEGNRFGPEDAPNQVCEVWEIRP